METTGAARGLLPHPRWAVLSLAAACATVGLKLLAYRLTGSVGILSDALESLVNLAAAVVLLGTLWFGSAPPDPAHPYGHEKVEYFASGFEGALILVAAWEIAWTAVPRLLAPAPVEGLGSGVLLVLLATAVNALVAAVLIAQGRKYRSLSLEADGRHLLADVVTSLGVVCGLSLVAVTHIARLDPLIALAVAANIVFTGVGLVRRSVHGLLDRALEPDEIAAIQSAIARQLRPGMTYHELRTRRAGPRRLADVHVLVPGELSVREGHALATAVEHAVRSALADAEMTVHVEPLEGERGAGHEPAPAITRDL